MPAVRRLLASGRFIFVAACCTLLVPAVGRSADWPQYRADAARGGYTADPLPANLAVQWVRQARHAPRRAWVGRSLARSRMKFDWAYSVVVADGRCFFGSSADDKVYALDAVTGEEQWDFFTGGPVRLAPAVWQDRLLVASDDGFLYCLATGDGKLLWKLRAGPNAERVLGNSRMVSRWVVRGGPAVRDGVVYFGAGIWPAENVYIYALDAADGEIRWCNDHTGILEIDQPHMVCHSRGGVTPQGYLAVTDDAVLVPTGRSVPAVFDRASGNFVHFHLGRYGGKTPWGTGGGDVVAAGDVFFNAGMAFDVPTGLRYHPVGERYWWDPFTRDGRKLHGEFLLGQRQVINVTPDRFIRSEGPAVYGSRLTQRTYEARREAPTARATPRLETVKTISDKHHLERIAGAPALEDLWKIDVPQQPEAMIVADTSIVWGADRRVGVIDAATRQTTWSAEVDGMVHSLAAAAGRLYVSTDRGTIYCFGSADEATAGRRLAPRPKRSPYPVDSVAARAAEEILRLSGVTSGFCLDLDCGDGALAYELAARSELSVVALTDDPARAERARRLLDEAGVYGVRVAVVVGQPKDLPDYFANLIVSSETIARGAADVPRGEIARLQRPYGGVVCLGPPGRMQVDVRGELPGGGQWTHNLADAGNTLNSGDTIVRGPLGMLWYQDETQETIDRHGKNPAPLFYKGLLLREGIDTVKCLDAYNGSLRWEVELPGVLAAYREGTQVGGGQIGSTYCVADDLLYVRQDDRCYVFDVFTGKRHDEFRACPWRDASATPADGRRVRWGYLACKDGILYGALMNEDYVIKSQHGDGGPRMQSPMENHLTESSLLFAMDAKTGELRWAFDPQYSIRNNAIAVGDGLVYVIDRPVARIDQYLKTELAARRRGRDPSLEHPPGDLLALDARTGKVQWRDAANAFGTTLSVSTKHDVLLMSYCRIGFVRPSDQHSGMRAYRASDGKVLWESKQSAMRPTIVGRTIFSFPFAWDLLTGRQRCLAEARPGQAAGEPWRIRGKGQGCGLVAGCDNLLLIRSGALGYYDLAYDRGWMENYGGLRSGCFLNALPVGGIVVAPDDTRACRCSYQNQATIALITHGVRPPEIDPQAGQTNFRFGRHLKEPAFTGSLLITMGHEDPDVEIRYTLDNSYPTKDSPRYTEPIRISQTTPVRAAAFRNAQKLAERDVVIFTKVEDLRSVEFR